jgi:ankyrin repeat protein
VPGDASEQAPCEAYYGDPKNAEWYFSDAKVAALAVSAARGELERIDQLIAKGADPNGEGEEGMTPMEWAMRAQNKAGFRHLLDRGANPDSLARSRAVGDNRPAPWLPIRDAAADPHDSWWLQMLLSHGANPNVVQPKRGGDDTTDYSAGTTPLFSAIDSGRLENVDLLLKAGADVNHQDNHGETPLIRAVTFTPGHFRIVIRLLEAGADWRIRNNDGEDAAFRMVFFEDPQSGPGRDARPVIALLEKSGADMAAARKKVGEYRRRRDADTAARAKQTNGLHIKQTP